MVKIQQVKDFNLDHIFDCGQCFRWVKEEDGSYTGIAFGKIINIKTAPSLRGNSESNSETKSEGNSESNSETKSEINKEQGIMDLVNIEIQNSSEEDVQKIWKRYLDLDRDYSLIKKQLSKNDPVLAKAIEYGYGMRILNQDKWETIISFLISQNNNIPRIKKCIESLCVNFGEYIGEYRGRKYFDIPKPEVLSQLSEENLEDCKLGYRAKYIIETAKKVEMNGIQETYDYLTTLCGIGPKVANCILLFSMGEIGSFPIDVWVKRVMNQLYGIDKNDTKAMREYSEENFGEYGGIAQQYLFYHIREGRK